jgi:hypothetical protein
MNRWPPGSRPAATAAGAVLAVVLAGCGQQAGPVGGSAERETGAPPSVGVSLPPGDPGLDAPAAPDPGTAPAEPHGDEEVRRTVPVRAMLTAADLRMTVGGRWQRDPGGAGDCVAVDGAVATRTMSYGGTPAGSVVETVASYAGADGSDAAVLDLRETLERCGWSDVHDPRLGSAAVAARDGARTTTAVSVEGVLVVLVGSGKVTDGWRWGTLVDIAAGSSCPAAPDGCH